MSGSWLHCAASGFIRRSQRGSHIRMEKRLDDETLMITVPAQIGRCEAVHAQSIS